jgi:glycosyltransferase involved in cell wall biosynthesis
LSACFVFWENYPGGVREHIHCLKKLATKPNSTASFLGVAIRSPGVSQGALWLFNIVRKLRKIDERTVVIAQGNILGFLVVLFCRANVRIHLHNELKYESWKGRLLMRALQLSSRVSFAVVNPSQLASFPENRVVLSPPVWQQFEKNIGAVLNKGQVASTACAVTCFGIVGRRKSGKRISSTTSRFIDLVSKGLISDVRLEVVSNQICDVPRVRDIVKLRAWTSGGKSEVYENMQFLIIGSISEGFGLGIVEAAQLGIIPIIIGDLTGPRFILGEELWKSLGGFDDVYDAIQWVKSLSPEEVLRLQVSCFERSRMLQLGVEEYWLSFLEDSQLINFDEHQIAGSQQ